MPRKPTANALWAGEDASQISRAWVAVPACVVGAIVAIAAMAIIQAKQLVDLEVALPNGVKMTLKTSEGTIQFLELLDQLFKDQTRAAAARGVLEDKYGMYQLSSANVERAIERGDVNDELSKSLRKMLSNGEGPFKFDLHSFRDVRQTAVVKEFDKQATENYEDVVGELRERCEYSEGFCSNRPLEVYIAFNDKVAPGFGKVCNTSRLLGKTVMIQDPKTGKKPKTILLENSFEPCIENDHKNKGTFIEMNLNQGQDLFGVVLNGEMEMKASAYVPPRGYAFVPEEQFGSDLARSIAVKE